MKTQYDPVDMFWWYYEKVKSEHPDFSNVPEEKSNRLLRMFKIMRYFLDKKYEVEELKAATFLIELQMKRKMKKGRG